MLFQTGHYIQIFKMMFDCRTLIIYRCDPFQFCSYISLSFFFPLTTYIGSKSFRTLKRVKRYQIYKWKQNKFENISSEVYLKRYIQIISITLGVGWQRFLKRQKYEKKIVNQPNTNPQAALKYIETNKNWSATALVFEILRDSYMDRY